MVTEPDPEAVGPPTLGVVALLLAVLGALVGASLVNLVNGEITTGISGLVLAGALGPLLLRARVGRR
ncbi:MAG: hypothetical protein AAF547_19840 [Actinomycetota bacterium]